MNESSKRKSMNYISSGWKIYLSEVKGEILQENPDISKREIYSIASKLWEELPKTKKAAYSRKEKRHNKRKKDKSESDEEELFDNEKIKQHISVYSVFVNEKQMELKETNPNLTLLERTNIISAMWDELTANDKHIYENKAKRYNRLIDKDSTDSDDEKYIIRIKVKSKAKESV